MDDLICRQVAIDAVNEYFTRIGKLKRRGLSKAEKAISLDTVGAINSLPPAQQWIPCSERLPEIDSDGYSDKVLVCYQNFVGIEICEYRVIDGRGKWYVGDLDVSPEDVGIVVLAWMPLPPVFKAESEGEKC